MPNISEFDAPSNLGLQPSETGVEATARAAQRINLYGSQEAQDLTQVGDRIGRGVASVGEAAVQYMEHREISTIGKNASMVRLGLENQLAEKLKDPNFDPDDPSFAQKFIEENVNKTLDDFQSGPITEGGQKFAQQEADHMRSQMATQVHAVSSKLAGDAIINNVKETANNSAGAAFINPASVFDSMAMFDRTLHAKASTSPNLDAEGYARVMSESGYAGEKQIAQAAIQGTIVNGGDWKKLASDPRISPYVNQAETMGFVRQEQTYQRMDVAAQKSIEASDREKARVDFNQSANKLELSTIPTAPGQRPQLPNDYWDTVRKLGPTTGAAMEPGRFKSLIDTGEAITERLNKDNPVTDKATEDKLFTGLFDPEHPTTYTDIVKNGDKLSDDSIKRLTEFSRMLKEEELSDPVFKDTMEDVKAKVQGVGEERKYQVGEYSKFMQLFVPEYLKEKRAGTLPPNALDPTDPKSLISTSMKSAKTALANSIGAAGGVGADAAPKEGARQQFKQGWGVYHNGQWVPETSQ